MIWWYLSIISQAPIVLKMPQNFLNELLDLHIYLHGTKERVSIFRQRLRYFFYLYLEKEKEGRR